MQSTYVPIAIPESDNPFAGGESGKGIVAALLAQFAAMRRLLTDPRRFAPWYNATGVTLYVLGMLASAFALRAVAGGAA